MRGALLVLGVLLAVQGCATSSQTEAAPPSESPAAVDLRMDACPAADGPAGDGDVLPELSFPCLAGSGDLTLGTAPGVPTVLNLWAPWCEPCRDELPLFDQLHTEAGEVVGVLGLVEKDTLASSLSYVSDAGLTFPSALDETGELLENQGINGLPVTFFLRADGSIAHREIGPIHSYEELRGLVAQHLGVTVP